MEISVEQRLTGREMRDDILHRHGSREALESAAKAGDLSAQDDLATLRLLDERPARLDEVFEVREVSRMVPKELADLSRTSLRVLEYLAAHPGATMSQVHQGLGVAWGTARHHMHVLDRLGLVRLERRGRWVHATAVPGLDIHITTPPRPVPAAPRKR